MVSFRRLLDSSMVLVMLLVFFDTPSLLAMQGVGNVNFANSDNVPTTNSISLEIDNIDEIPGYCANLAYRLSIQPLFHGETNVVTYIRGANRKIKILSIPWVDCRINDIINSNARHRRTEMEKALRIQEFGRDSYCKPTDAALISEGIYLEMINEEGSDLEDLKQTYKEIINDLKKGWEQSTLEVNPDIRFKQSEAEWCLFIKKQSLAEEDTLIRFLARKFDMEESIDCMNRWGEYEYRDKFYLWVKKDAIEQFQRVFRFEK